MDFYSLVTLLKMLDIAYIVNAIFVKNWSFSVKNIK